MSKMWLVLVVRSVLFSVVLVSACVGQSTDESAGALDTTPPLKDPSLQAVDQLLEQLDESDREISQKLKALKTRMVQIMADRDRQKQRDGAIPQPANTGQAAGDSGPSLPEPASNYDSRMAPQPTAPANSSNTKTANAIQLLSPDDLPPSQTPIPLDTQSQPMVRAAAPIQGPVNQKAVADNLYRAGEYELALEYYQRMPAEGQSGTKKLWKLYQEAVCYRAIGDINEARNRFREIANSGETEFYVDHSKWWLDFLEQQEFLQQQDQEIKKFNQYLRGQWKAANESQ